MRKIQQTKKKMKSKQQQREEKHRKMENKRRTNVLFNNILCGVIWRLFTSDALILTASIFPIFILNRIIVKFLFVDPIIICIPYLCMEGSVVHVMNMYNARNM